MTRALAIRPGVLLLDEPLSALDAQLRSAMLSELSRLHRELPDMSILYVTHDQIEALTLADRIAVMDKARLRDVGQADGKGLLQKYILKGADQVAGGDKAADATWTCVVNNYFGFVYDKKELKQAPTTWEELLDARYKNKLQYSTPGVAGDGTAVLVKAIHDFGGKEQALAYLKKLQANNVGPSASTGKLAPKVDKGELLVANGDVQMNYAQSKDMPNLGIWFPKATDKAADAAGKPTTFALPYAAGLVTKAPHADNGRKLLDFMLSAKAQQQVSEIGGGFSARKDVKATDANAIALTRLMDAVALFEPDWADIDKNLTSYVADWKTATGS
ncbi:2-aminoethylphosphonate ABC transporter substrate-binding protein [Streptomyces mirabilis]|uniref:2-aminoethylphosphonate ABC transporter substrate-binding protein n=1 Tax=Streptomyces mirabilis TaxID=68239 RepID=UPI0036AD75FE